jgi:hypothetical protein
VLRRLRVCLVSGMSALSLPAVAAGADATDAPTSDEATSDKPTIDKPTIDKPTSGDDLAANKSVAAPDVTATAEGSSSSNPPPAAPAAEQEASQQPGAWHVEVHGYFRAPMALSFSPRPDPTTPNGPAKGQISYAPNRIMDWSYYSFAYTRLQEQDWAELTFHIKKKHVDAAVGWMGYWLSASGFRNPDAAGVPGVGSLTLDTDVDVGGLKPNIALQMGAWWPGFGYFEKYDTYTLGRFRQMGEQLRITVPVNPDLKLEVVQGFGTSRDGSFNYSVAASSPLYAAKVGADLLAYGNIRLTYKKNVDVSLHLNNEWTRDPYLVGASEPADGKGYPQASDAHLSVVGAEANLSALYVGRLWISPSYISVKNGWALGGGGGTEVMHAQGGLGIATNYMAYADSPSDSSGTGSMFNLGFLYENTLSNVQGKTPGSVKHDVKLNIFGLMADSSLDLPANTTLKQSRIKQLKFGADVSVQALDWLGLMLRGDSVNYDTDHAGYIFSSITARLTVYSHFLSSESIYLQYSRYKYGDNMKLAGQWPWGTPLVAGTDVIQGGTYSGQKPDMDVIKLQATVAF